MTSREWSLSHLSHCFPQCFTHCTDKAFAKLNFFCFNATQCRRRQRKSNAFAVIITTCRQSCSFLVCRCLVDARKAHMILRGCRRSASSIFRLSYTTLIVIHKIDVCMVMLRARRLDRTSAVRGDWQLNYTDNTRSTPIYAPCNSI